MAQCQVHLAGKMTHSRPDQVDLGELILGYDILFPKARLNDLRM